MPRAEGIFGELVKKYISQHCLSYQDFASTLGFKSKTSISRIIQNETSYELRSQFFRRLNENYSLTAEEETSFREALYFSRLSETEQGYFRCFSNLLNADFLLEKRRDINFMSPDGGELGSLRELLNRRSECCYLITASIFGLPGAQFITTLYQLLSRCGCPFLIHHYVFSGDEIMPQLRCVTDSAPILFDQRYKIYRCLNGEDGAMLGNHLILRYSMEDGTQSEDILLLNAHGIPLYSGPMNSVLTDLYHHYLLSNEKLVVQIKSRYDESSRCDQLNSFVGIQKRIIQLEEDCAIYCFKKGLSIEFIPPDIYKCAIQMDHLPQQDRKETLNQLIHMQRKRHQHLLMSKKPTYYLLSHNAFQRFIWTGHLANHPPFLRSLSPKERYSILTLILEQIDQSPYFSIRFTSEEMPIIYNHLALTGYQHMQYTSAHRTKGSDGLLIQPSLESTSYTSYVMLSNEELAAAFSLFFREELISRYAEPAKKSRHFLYNMLEYLQTRVF